LNCDAEAASYGPLSETVVPMTISAARAAVVYTPVSVSANAAITGTTVAKNHAPTERRIPLTHV